MMSATVPGPAAGSTVLPRGCSHRHASEEARAIAEKGMILRVQVGSGVQEAAMTGGAGRGRKASRQNAVLASQPSTTAPSP
jgi:hypothetical protein